MRCELFINKYIYQYNILVLFYFKHNKCFTTSMSWSPKGHTTKYDIKKLKKGDLYVTLINHYMFKMFLKLGTVKVFTAF